MLNEEVKKYRELSGDASPNTSISRIVGYLDGYEKALDQTRWIPVSESLPKYNKTVLVSVKQKGKEAMVFTAQRRRRVNTPDLFECCMDDEGWWDFRIAA